VDDRFGLPNHPVRRIHFVGIGGAGMSGIAEVMMNLGYEVSGSDLADNASTRRLVGLGASIVPRHEAENVARADVVVHSGAIRADNPEIRAAHLQRIPVVPRAEMLAELMRFRQGIAVAGTHGKTTTTSLIASVLAECGLDPTFVIGGRLMSAASHARLGGGRYLVAEADESDGSFLRLTPVIAVLTNIDNDHLAAYDHDFTRLVDAFTEFMNRVPFYGLGLVCIDDPMAASIVDAVHRRVVTYGLSEHADYRVRHIVPEGTSTRFELLTPGGDVHALRVNLVGTHNVRNAVAAAALALELGGAPAAIASALETFEGIARRSNILGDFELAGCRFRLVDDYGHHPRELDAVMQAFRSAWPERRLVVVFQPHRYSRTAELLDDFANVLSGADALVVLDVYPAGEEPTPAGHARHLVNAVRARHLVDPIYLDRRENLAEFVGGQLEGDDTVIFFGAGDIGQLVQDFRATLTEVTHGR